MSVFCSHDTNDDVIVIAPVLFCNPLALSVLAQSSSHVHRELDNSTVLTANTTKIGVNQL